MLAFQFGYVVKECTYTNNSESMEHLTSIPAKNRFIKWALKVIRGLKMASNTRWITLADTLSDTRRGFFFLGDMLHALICWETILSLCCIFPITFYRSNCGSFCLWSSPRIYCLSPHIIFPLNNFVLSVAEWVLGNIPKFSFVLRAPNSFCWLCFRFFHRQTCFIHLPSNFNKRHVITFTLIWWLLHKELHLI